MTHICNEGSVSWDEDEFKDLLIEEEIERDIIALPIDLEETKCDHLLKLR